MHDTKLTNDSIVSVIFGDPENTEESFERIWDCQAKTGSGIKWMKGFAEYRAIFSC